MGREVQVSQVTDVLYPGSYGPRGSKGIEVTNRVTCRLLVVHLCKWVDITINIISSRKSAYFVRLKNKITEVNLEISPAHMD